MRIVTNAKTFRPDDVGSRQRFVHWATAAAALLVFALAGTPGIAIYIFGLLLLHARWPDKIRSRNIMERVLDARERELTRDWNAFFAATNRRALSLPGRRPHRFIAIASLPAVLLLVMVVGAYLDDTPTGLGVVTRLAVALWASAALWRAFFGLARRTPLVFGADGVRVRDTFVPYATVLRCERRPNGVVFVQRASPLPGIALTMSDAETADRLVSLLTSERERTRLRGTESSAPTPAGFRESASPAGWRVRVLEATSDDERRAVLARVAPDELRELLSETADPSLEGAVLDALEPQGHEGR